MSKKLPFLIIPKRDSNFEEKLEIDAKTVANLTGAPSTVLVEDIYHNGNKFAFYYCGQLCEVRFDDGSHHIQVSCIGYTEQRSQEVLGYVCTNIRATLNFRGYDADVTKCFPYAIVTVKMYEEE